MLFLILGAEIFTAFSILICSWPGTVIHPALALPLIPLYAVTYHADWFTRNDSEARVLGFAFRIVVIELVLWGWRADRIVLCTWLVGEGLNLLALAANNLFMPIACSTKTWQHTPIDASTRLRWLCDIFPGYVPRRKKVACYFSIGDILEVLGLAMVSTLLWVSYFYPTEHLTFWR